MSTWHPVLASQGSPIGTFAGLLPILIIIGIFYLLIYRPMKVRQKNHEKLIASLENGDKVITAGGVHGVVAGVRDHTVMLKVSDKVKLEVAKSSISSRQSAKEEGSSD